MNKIKHTKLFGYEITIRPTIMDNPDYRYSYEFIHDGCKHTSYGYRSEAMALLQVNSAIKTLKQGNRK